MKAVITDEAVDVTETKVEKILKKITPLHPPTLTPSVAEVHSPPDHVTVWAAIHPVCACLLCLCTSATLYTSATKGVGLSPLSRSLSLFFPFSLIHDGE